MSGVLYLSLVRLVVSLGVWNWSLDVLILDTLGESWDSPPSVLVEGWTRCFSCGLAGKKAGSTIAFRTRYAIVKAVYCIGSLFNFP
jgi:hypothetical protein